MQASFSHCSFSALGFCYKISSFLCQIKAIKIGRNFAIPKKYIADILGKVLGEEDKREIDSAVKKTVREYGEVLKLLGRE